MAALTDGSPMMTSRFQKYIGSALLLLSVGAQGSQANQGVAQIGSVVPGLTVTSMRVKTMRDMRYKNVVRQEKDFTCGAAALATLLQNLYGHTASEKEIIVDMLKNTDEKIVRTRGFSLLDMKHYAERIGLRGRGYNIDKNSLLATKIPVIALQNVRGYAHFVVIRRVYGDIVYIADPALGNRQMWLDDFIKSWNGIIFAVVGKGMNIENALYSNAKPLVARERANIVTNTTLPQHKEFGLSGVGGF